MRGVRWLRCNRWNLWYKMYVQSLHWISEVHARCFLLACVNVIFCERVHYIGNPQQVGRFECVSYIEQVKSKIQNSKSYYCKKKIILTISCVFIKNVVLIYKQNYFQWEKHQRNKGREEKVFLMYFIVYSSKVTKNLIKIQ